MISSQCFLKTAGFLCRHFSVKRFDAILLLQRFVRLKDRKWHQKWAKNSARAWRAVEYGEIIWNVYMCSCDVSVEELPQRIQKFPLWKTIWYMISLRLLAFECKKYCNWYIPINIHLNTVFQMSYEWHKDSTNDLFKIYI